MWKRTLRQNGTRPTNATLTKILSKVRLKTLTPDHRIEYANRTYAPTNLRREKVGVDRIRGIIEGCFGRGGNCRGYEVL